MPYLNLDDGFAQHRKVRRLSDSAFRLHVAGLCYCAQQMSDGEVDAEDVPTLVRRFKRSSLDELLERGMWRKKGANHYEIHDYLEWNKSRSWWTERRRAAAERQAKSRAARESAQ